MIPSGRFSKKELVSILELIDGSRNCKTHEDAHSLMLSAKELLSADYSVCGMGRIAGENMDDVAGVVNGGYPSEWLDHYFRDRLYRFDPVIRYHRSFSPSEIWSEINKLFDDKEAGLVIKTARDFGLRHGLSSSVVSPDGTMISIFSFAGENNTFKPHHKCILDTVSLHLNIAMHNTVCHRSLFTETQKEREVPLV